MSLQSAGALNPDAGINIRNVADSIINPATEGTLSTIAGAVSGTAVWVQIAGGGAGDGAILDGVSSSIKATVLDYSNSNPIAVRLTDTVGDYAIQPISGTVTVAQGTVSIGLISHITHATVTIDNASLPVTGTFWQSTQPVSIATAPLTPISGTVTVSQGTVTIGSIAHLGHGTVTIDNTSIAATQSGTWNIGISSGSNVIGTTTINDGGGSITVDGTFYQSVQPVSGSVSITAGTVSILNASLPVTGTFWQATQPVSLATAPLTPISGTVTVSQGTVTIGNTSIAVTQSGTWDEVGINDSGNSITVDGTFWQTVQPVSGSVSITAGTVSIGNTVTVGTHGVTIAAGSGTVTIGAGSQTIGTVTIQDGGNSITVDGTVTANLGTGSNVAGTVTINDGGGSITVDGSLTTVSTVTNLSQQGGVAISLNTGVRDTGTQRVTIATNDVVPASQSGTWNVGISAGSNTVGTATVIGAVAHDAVSAGNPVRVGAKAETSPKGITPVGDGDVTESYADADGLNMVKMNTSYADIVTERIASNNATATNFANLSGVASTRNYISHIAIWNSSANNTYVDILDRTGGTIIHTIPAPTLGGAIEDFIVPLRQTTAGSAMAYQVNTASSTVYISIVGFQSKL